MNFSNYYKSFFGVLVFLLLSCSNDDSLDMPLEPFVVAFESLSANLSQINVSTLPKGIYIIQVKTENGILQKKIVKA